MMLKTFLGLAVALTLALPMVARADDLFTDGTCEKATPVGRHLNELVQKNNTLTPELMAAATEMRDIYEACVSGYDRDTRNSAGRGGEQFSNTNGAIVGRVYSRLALARALQRLGQYDGYDKNLVEAEKAYSEALRRLDEMEQINPVGVTHPGTPERSLAMKGRDLRPTIEAARANLTASPGATSSAAPSASSSPAQKR